MRSAGKAWELLRKTASNPCGGENGISITTTILFGRRNKTTKCMIKHAIKNKPLNKRPLVQQIIGSMEIVTGMASFNDMQCTVTDKAQCEHIEYGWQKMKMKKASKLLMIAINHMAWQLLMKHRGIKVGTRAKRRTLS